MTEAAPRLGIVVFARFDSARLPGKALKPIAGQPMLQHVIQRSRRAVGGYPVCVATTERSVDDPICRLAAALGADVFRGHVEDVSKRALNCARSRGFEHFVRISGDSPFIDPDIISGGIDIHLKERPDLTTNVDPRSYPLGCSVEVIATAALERVLAEPSSEEDREHVTRPIYAARSRFKIRNFTSGRDDYAAVRLVVDTAEDHARAEWIASQAQPDVGSASLEEVIHWAELWAQRQQSPQSWAKTS